MKRKKLWMSATLMCGFCAIAFTFDNHGIYWLWADARPAAWILLMATMLFGAMWYASAKNGQERQTRS